MLDQDDVTLVTLPIVIMCILGVIFIYATITKESQTQTINGFSHSTDKIVSQSNVASNIKSTKPTAENNIYNISGSTNIIGDNNIVNITPVAEENKEVTKESKESPFGYIPWVITGLLGALIVGYKIIKEVLVFKTKEFELK